MTRDSLAQYRLRKAAVQLRSFTVTDLTSATGLNRESIQVFLHRLEKKGSLPLTKENLPIREPGRPIVRYTLTSEGIDILRTENEPIARELNDSRLDEAPTVPRLEARAPQAQRPWTRRPGDPAREADLGNKAAVAALAPLLRSTEEPCPLILLGAGASFRSGVPTAADAVKQIARLVYSERELKNSRPPERVKPSEWEAWLQAFDWFIPGPDRLAENFPLIVENLLVPAEFRKRVLLDLMRPVNGISIGYKILADFVMRGLVQTVFTTNFDTCLPDALRERQPHIRHIHEVNRGPGDYDQFNVYSRCQIIWLHGRAEQYSDKNAAGETGALDKGLAFSSSSDARRLTDNCHWVSRFGAVGHGGTVRPEQRRPTRFSARRVLVYAARREPASQCGSLRAASRLQFPPAEDRRIRRAFRGTRRRNSQVTTAILLREPAAGRFTMLRPSTSASLRSARSKIWIWIWRCRSCASIARNLGVRP